LSFQKREADEGEEEEMFEDAEDPEEEANSLFRD